jgi:hypothetical protein
LHETLPAMFSKKALQILEPEKIEPFSREENLISQLHMIDAEREKIGAAMRDFRSRKTVLIDGRLMYQADTIHERPQLDSIWNGLLTADSRLIETRNRILRELARLKVPTAYVQ